VLIGFTGDRVWELMDVNEIRSLARANFNIYAFRRCR
jgi:hypothetical protein